MVVFMPNQVGNFSIFMQANISALMDAELAVATFLTKCYLQMPKFTISHRLENAENLFRSMGVVDVFDENSANFSRMMNFDNIYLQKIDHQTVLSVDEMGVRAAASTAAHIGVRTVIPKVRIDKPFILMIRHINTGAILFLGRVVKPSKR